MIITRGTRKLLRLARSCRERFLSWRYAQVLGIPANHLRVTGTCDLRIEGECSVGERLYVRSRDHNQVQISVLKNGRLIIGQRVFLNQGVRIVASTEIVIGSNVLIGDEVIILDGDFHGVGHRAAQASPVRIEDDVWIASRAIILKGVTLGHGAVVGAGAVVTKSVPAHSFVSGPAATVKRVLRQ